jgi:predicted nucleic acid-binding protein
VKNGPITLDTGAVIAFERERRPIIAFLTNAWRGGTAIHVPTVVVAEAWRGGSRSARVGRLLSACRVDPLLEPVARLAGEAIARVRGATTIDAIVVASASVNGSAILTADNDDLEPLADWFGGVPSC